VNFLIVISSVEKWSIQPLNKETTFEKSEGLLFVVVVVVVVLVVGNSFTGSLKYKVKKICVHPTNKNP